MVTTHECVVYSVNAEDIEAENEVWYAWFCKQDETKQKQIIERFADYLSELFYGMSDEIYECLDDAMCVEGYRKD